jgi:hypothetical protein
MKTKPRFERRKKYTGKAFTDYGNKVKQPDIRPLDQREHPLNTRKGMPNVKCQGFFDTSKYREQLIFDNSQRNCNGYIPEET